MSGANYVLAMTGMGTSQDDLARITQAICDINKTIRLDLSEEKEIKISTRLWESIDFTAAVQTEMPLWEALAWEHRDKMVLDMAAGQLVGDFIIPYPPGIPVLLPSSRISPEMVVYLNELLDRKVAVVGIETNRTVTIIKKEPVIMEKKSSGTTDCYRRSGRQRETNPNPVAL